MNNTKNDNVIALNRVNDVMSTAGHQAHCASRRTSLHAQQWIGSQSVDRIDYFLEIGTRLANAELIYARDSDDGFGPSHDSFEQFVLVITVPRTVQRLAHNAVKSWQL